jgi:hypothetical protein
MNRSRSKIWCLLLWAEFHLCSPLSIGLNLDGNFLPLDFEKHDDFLSTASAFVDAHSLHALQGGCSYHADIGERHTCLVSILVAAMRAKVDDDHRWLRRFEVSESAQLSLVVSLIGASEFVNYLRS